MSHHDREPEHQSLSGASDRDTPPALRAFVVAAREQPIVQTCVTAEAVAAGLAHHNRRSHARRTLLLSGAMAVAASVVAVVLLSPLLSGSERDQHEAKQLERERELDQGASDSLPTLSSAVRLRSTDSIVVRDPWSIALGEGSHELEVDPSPGHALKIELPGRKLELVEGRMTIEVVQSSAAVRLHTGVAAWVDEDSQRISISVERIGLEPEAPEGDATLATPSQPAEVGAGAGELAREAELLLAAGKRDLAIEVYRQLARKHPRASQTRAAVLDLARLLRADGRKDEARCAYELYLERWPKSSVRAEVESQLDRLGDGPGCRGLSPNPR